MNKQALEEIDFFRIRDSIASFCISQDGKEVLLEREPLTDFKKIENLKNLSREWTSYISAASTAPLSSWEEIHPLYAVIRTNGAALSLEQVYALGQFTLSVKKVLSQIQNYKDKLDFKYLTEEAAKIPDFQETEKKIFSIISTDGQLRDLPEIAAIRKEIAGLNQKIKNIMQSFTSNQKLASALESSVPVLRNGRQVLAVKSNQANRIPGIIHEVSQSAQTVYIEPEDAVRCSNDLIQKQHELAQVIKQILTKLTQSLQPSLPLFKAALPVMELFDTTYAAAQWGLSVNAVYALACKNEPPLLLQARHPLLGGKAVPIDIRFLDNKNVLIITGPNTGGKTVTLKTFALFAMLNQSGFPIPAAEGSRLPVFSNIYTDIGDNQSLDQSLSTFSAHMKNIAEAVKNARSDTLILLDELGSGTDPQEGTAISMAVLDKLIEKKSFVLVTTHQGILKNYGYTNPSCINASVEFDAGTLSPSYHLLMGVPGESHALDIAQKNGLPLEIVKSARNYIATEQADVSALIRGLNRKHLELNKLQKEAESLKSVNDEKTLRLKEKELQLRKKEQEIKEGKQQELNDFLIHSRRTLENLVRTLKEGEVTREKTISVKHYISELEGDTQRLEKKIEDQNEKLVKAQEEFEKEVLKGKHPASNKKTKKKMSNARALETATPVIPQLLANNKPVKKEEAAVLCIGATVCHKTTLMQGSVIAENKKKGWQVQFGSVKMFCKEKDLKVLSSEKTQYSPDISIELNSSGDGITYKDEAPAFELRLLGYRVEEAIKALDRQINLCILHNFHSFSVIHGKGDGVLQQAVTDYLSHCNLVKDFSFAAADDGGTGKTYVQL